jgi:predicted DNA-binding transcriptional regulator AlpA
MEREMKQNASNDGFLTINQLCEKLAISRPTIWRMRKRDPLFDDLFIEIPPGSGRYRIIQSRLYAWIDQSS